MADAAPFKQLNLCDACGRQYDVTHLDSGRRVRCECGARVVVRRNAPHEPRALRCSQCGGNRKVDAKACEYCGAEVTLEEKRLSCVCPKCCARLASDARFCMECGVEIAPQALFALEESLRCPRCKGALRSRSLGHTSVVECGSCGGLWLDEAAFVRICERAEAESVPAGSLSRPALPGATNAPVQGYIPCLACSQLMTRKNYASSSGVIVDACRNHGVWLDAHELERVLAFIRAGGLERARQRQIETLRNEQQKLRAAERASHGLHLGPLEEHAGWGTKRAKIDAFGTTLDLVLDLLF